MENKDIKDNELESLELENQIEDIPNTSGSFQNEALLQKSKKSKKWLILFLIIFGVLILTFISIALYFLYFQPKTTPAVTQTSQTNNSQPVKDATDYAAEIIGKVRTEEGKLTGSYPNLKVEDDQPNSPGYKAPSTNYYIGGEFGHSLLVSTSNTATLPQDPAITTAQATANNTVSSSSDNLIKTSSDYSTVYTGINVICTISKDSYPVFVTCANIRDYTNLSNQIKPFADAFFKDKDNQATQGSYSFRAPIITKKSDGYANATVSAGPYEGVGGFAALFYGKDGNWTYWRGTQSEIACTDFNTLALQKSFEGMTCYDESINGESTVKVVS